MSSKKRKRDRARQLEAKRKKSAAKRGYVWWIGASVAVAVAFVAASGLFQADEPAVASPIEFTDVREETQKFIDYYNSIELTPEQELIKKQALSRIPAPCCSDNSAYTCCCPCNMAKSWWGLSHHLIVNEGASAEEVQAAVEGWIEFINPKGFSGRSCYTGGCVRPFHRNGCGGMNEDKIVF